MSELDWLDDDERGLEMWEKSKTTNIYRGAEKNGNKNVIKTDC